MVLLAVVIGELVLVQLWWSWSSLTFESAGSGVSSQHISHISTIDLLVVLVFFNILECWHWHQQAIPILGLIALLFVFCLVHCSWADAALCLVQLGFSLVGFNTEILLGQMLVSFRWVAQSLVLLRC